MLKNNYKATITACFTGYFTQSIIVNFLPLLFVYFCTGYNISLEQVTVLISLNFFLQLLTDVVSTKLIQKIGYRAGIILANVLAFIGLASLFFLPNVIDPFLALLLSVFLCAIGSGLEEVLISPIVEACPTKRKSAIMSLTHSFYSWGTVIVIGLSTGFFLLFGTSKWGALSLVWSVGPLINILLFSFVPIYNHKDDGGEKVSILSVMKNKVFWLFALLMACAGAAELSMGQWASAFAEMALKVDKAVGDMAGACLFALLMAIARVLYATLSEKIRLEKFMVLSAVLCVIAYVLAIFSPYPWVSLVAVGLCGFSVGVMWPGTISLASKTMASSTALFAMLAVFGDVGAIVGPGIVGFVSSAFGGNLKVGLACIIVFPVLLILGVYKTARLGKNKQSESQLEVASDIKKN